MTTEPRILVIGDPTNTTSIEVKVGRFNLKIMNFLLLAVLGALATAQERVQTDPSVPLTANEIVERLMAADRTRFEKLKTYTSVRNYSMLNQRFNKSARMKVKVSFQYPGEFSYEVLEEEGPGIVRKQAFQRMLKSEQEALQKENRAGTLVSLNNYEFKLLREEPLDGRRSYVLSALPITKNKFLFRGEIWIDAEDFALARIEGAPAQKHSFWVRKTRFVHRNSKVGEFWVPQSNLSITDVMIFGSTDVEIHYGEYGVNELALR